MNRQRLTKRERISQPARDRHRPTDGQTEADQKTESKTDTDRG